MDRLSGCSPQEEGRQAGLLHGRTRRPTTRKLIAALDGAKQAGAETLGMMTELPDSMKQPAGGAPPTEGAAPAPAVAPDTAATPSTP